MSDQNSKTVLILGANGRFGRNAANAFANAGWTVFSHTRMGTNLSDDVAGIHTPFDIQNVDDFHATAAKCNVIVNALHPPYPTWSTELPKMTKVVIDAARTSGATIMIAGNIYNFGVAMPPLLNESTPHAARTKKGKLRIDMEKSYKTAADQGVQTIILRCGDFIERKKTGNWFDSHLTGKLKRGKFAYPGKQNIKHAWAYLPDSGRAIVELAEIRDNLETFEDIPFEGSSLTAIELRDAISIQMNRKMRITGFPWFAINAMSFFSPLMRELLEMRYLWDIEHSVDGAKLARLLPNFKPTSTREIMKDILADHMN